MRLDERIEAYRQQNPAHAPVNPLTGVPNSQDSDGESGRAAADGPGPAVADAAGSGPAAGPGAVSASSSAAGPDDPVQAPYEPAPLDVDDDLFDRARSVTDNRVVATLSLVFLLIAIVGLQNPLVFAVALVGGYMLVDRFLVVRRAVAMGGITWALMIFLGNIVSNRFEAPIVVTLSSVFVFVGFFLAISVCCVYFASRASYHYGIRRGQAQADRVVAQHIVDRLIEHPDDWGELDGDFLEVEGALNRARERERTSEQALRDESRRKDDLVTYLAHDLKTPLASVVGYLSLLEEAPDLPVEQRKRFTGVALEKAHRLDALIEEFFDITRFDFHDIVLTRGYVDLGLMLAQVADEFYPILSDQGKSVEVDVAQGITVLVDGDKMARVFNNVMKNAVAYSYEGSTIHVSAVRAEGSVVIRFENQGDPIPAAKLNVIFEKFYRLDASRATNRGGAGLGLAIAKEIVTAHGGNITCDSTPERTVFTIELPEE